MEHNLRIDGKFSALPFEPAKSKTSDKQKEYVMKKYGIESKVYDKFCAGYTLEQLTSKPTKINKSNKQKEYVMKNYGIESKVYDKFCEGYTLEELTKVPDPKKAKQYNASVPEPSGDELKKYDIAYSKLMSIYMTYSAHESKERLQNKGMSAIAISCDNLAIFDADVRKEADEAMAIITAMNAKYPGFMQSYIDNKYNRISFEHLYKA